MKEIKPPKVSITPDLNQRSKAPFFGVSRRRQRQAQQRKDIQVSKLLEREIVKAAIERAEIAHSRKNPHLQSFLSSLLERKEHKEVSEEPPELPAI